MTLVRVSVRAVSPARDWPLRDHWYVAAGLAATPAMSVTLPVGITVAPTG